MVNRMDVPLEGIDVVARNDAAKRLDDLVLLAMKGMGWPVTDSLGRDGQRHYVANTEDGLRLLGEELPNGPESWDPYTKLRDAGMLQRALGIALRPIADALDNVIGWVHVIGWAAVGPYSVSASAHGNTEAAQCRAICECALEIVRARRA
mgnify:CR=1 FL=1